MKLHSCETKTTESLIKTSALAVLILLGATSAYAQYPQGTIEYSSKFLCGTTSSATTMVQPVNGATFRTTINIHNPALPNTTPLSSVSFYKKAVQSLSEGTTPPAPGTPVLLSLSADYTLEVDCKDIETTLLPANPGAGFVEGWVVIYSLPTLGVNGGANTPNPLDVVGVYTNSLGAIKMQPAIQDNF